MCWGLRFDVFCRPQRQPLSLLFSLLFSLIAFTSGIQDSRLETWAERVASGREIECRSLREILPAAKTVCLSMCDAKVNADWVEGMRQRSKERQSERRTTMQAKNKPPVLLLDNESLRDQLLQMLLPCCDRTTSSGNKETRSTRKENVARSWVNEIERKCRNLKKKSLLLWKEREKSEREKREKAPETVHPLVFFSASCFNARPPVHPVVASLPSLTDCRLSLWN